MVCYKLHWKTSAKKELKRLDPAIIPSIIKAVESLAENPHPIGHKKLHEGQHAYRIRVHDYRVIYSIENQILTIEIIRIAHRREVYRRHLSI